MWLSRGEYKRLLRALARAERRADSCFAALADERAGNREAERHFANMLMRRAGTFPLPPKPVAQSADGPELQPASEIPGMDPGEIEALVLAGTEYGQTRADVIRFLRNERGL